LTPANIIMHYLSNQWHNLIIANNCSIWATKLYHTKNSNLPEQPFNVRAGLCEAGVYSISATNMIHQDLTTFDMELSANMIKKTINIKYLHINKDCRLVSPTYYWGKQLKYQSFTTCTTSNNWVNLIQSTIRAHSAVEWPSWFGNSKKVNFWNLKKKLLWHVGNIINFNNSTQKSIQIHFLMAFSIHEVAPFCLFCHFLLFLCSDIIQIFNCILIGGNLWIKFHFFHVM
jgi:hypothetical protein